MIVYKTDAGDIRAGQLTSFFVGWPNPPTAARHLRLLQNSDFVVLAVDDESASVVGFVTAISDGVLSAYVPLLEVLPAYQQQGIGSELMRRLLDQMQHLYMIDLLCDADVQPFYARLGMQPASGILIRHYANQHGVSERRE